MSSSVFPGDGRANIPDNVDPCETESDAFMDFFNINMIVHLCSGELCI